LIILSVYLSVMLCTVTLRVFPAGHFLFTVTSPNTLAVGSVVIKHSDWFKSRVWCASKADFQYQKWTSVWNCKSVNIYT